MKPVSYQPWCRVSEGIMCRSKCCSPTWCKIDQVWGHICLGCVCVFPPCALSHLDPIQFWYGSCALTVDWRAPEPELACGRLALSYEWVPSPSHTSQILFYSALLAEGKLWIYLWVSSSKFVPEIHITFLNASLPSDPKITSGLNPLCLKIFLFRGLGV